MKHSGKIKAGKPRCVACATKARKRSARFCINCGAAMPARGVQKTATAAVPGDARQQVHAAVHKAAGAQLQALRRDIDAVGNGITLLAQRQAVPAFEMLASPDPAERERGWEQVYGVFTR